MSERVIRGYCEKKGHNFEHSTTRIKRKKPIFLDRRTTTTLLGKLENRWLFYAVLLFLLFSFFGKKFWDEEFMRCAAVFAMSLKWRTRTAEERAEQKLGNAECVHF